MDSDCAFDAEQIQKVADMTPLDTGVYKFDRNRIGSGEKSLNWKGELREENLKNTRYLPCTMLMNQNLFWQIGGFDEDYTGERSGGYGLFDSDFDRRLGRADIPWYKMKNIIATEWMPSVCDGEIASRHPKAHEIGMNLYRLKNHFNENRKDEWLEQNREILRFQWERTYWHSYES
jgi:hypothetical protein